MSNEKEKTTSIIDDTTTTTATDSDSKHKKKKKMKTKSIRAGVTLPVCRVHSLLRKGCYGKRTSGYAAVHLTAAVEYMLTELIRMVEIEMEPKKKTTITPRYISLALRRDEDFAKLTNTSIVSHGIKSTLF